MVAHEERGSGNVLEWRDNGIEARGAEIVRKYQDFASDEGVFDDLFACLRRNLNAKKSMRVESTARESGYSYEVVEDSLSQIAAARTLAQIMRLMPSASSSVTVNNTQNNVQVSAEQRVAELESIGVPKEQMREACLAMLEVASKPDVTQLPKQ